MTISKRAILALLVKKEVSETGKAGRESIRFAIENRIDLNKFLRDIKY